ncbi:hypothetical protein [Mycobacterium arosiense]|uniref:hypothetical protein n=1 Tax=Mycobacterium arosiense TaxID=425468 RepID=UPI0009F43326|nr:hypothetical protein [Mycobacterium arosiense]
MSKEIWQLKHDAELIGEIHITGGEFPWPSSTFVALPGFARFKPLFDRELELVDDLSDDPDPGDAMDSWEQAYDLISNALTLVNDRGTPVAEYLLHIHDSDAWFHWSDEPFDE